MTGTTPEATGEDEIARRVAELQEALTALRSGGVDAVVLGDADGSGTAGIHTLSGADRPYRTIVECMGEGAATVTSDGMVVFANRQLGVLLGFDAGTMVGADVTTYVGEGHRAVLGELLATEPGETRRAELALTTQAGSEVPVLVAATALDVAGSLVRCLVVTDLTEQKRMERELAVESARAQQRAERQRVAHEVNDTIVQGLVTAEMMLDLDQVEKARRVIAAISDQARRWIGELAEGQELAPGRAVRSAPATAGGGLP